MSPPTGADAVTQNVARVLTEEIRPLLQRDGGDIELLGVNHGVVRVRLHGTCAGCPTAIMSVIMGIEQELRQRVPEVEYLEAVP
jgi:Fe-S cluster biogenesis protein NfuA